MNELTDLELGILHMENRLWIESGPKDAAILLELGLSPLRYYQLLNVLLDDGRALRHNPVLVNRLRRRRETLRAARAARRAS